MKVAIVLPFLLLQLVQSLIAVDKETGDEDYPTGLADSAPHFGEQRMLVSKQTSVSEVKNNMRNIINAEIKKAKKSGKTSNKQIRKKAKKIQKKIKLLMKSSHDDFEEFKTAIIKARKITIKTVDYMRDLLTSTVGFLKTDVRNSAISLKAVTRGFIHQVTAYAISNLKVLRDLVNKGKTPEALAKAKEMRFELDELEQCSREGLMEVFNNWEIAIMPIATLGADEIKEKGIAAINEFKTITLNNKYLHRYITYITSRMNEVTETVRLKFVQGTEVCLGETKKISLIYTEIVVKIVKLEKAIVDDVLAKDLEKEKQHIIDINDIINDFEDDIDKKEKEMYDLFSKEMKSMFDSFIKSIKDMVMCDPVQVEKC